MIVASVTQTCFSTPSLWEGLCLKSLRRRLRALCPGLTFVAEEAYVRELGPECARYLRLRLVQFLEHADLLVLVEAEGGCVFNSLIAKLEARSRDQPYMLSAEAAPSVLVFPEDI